MGFQNHVDPEIGEKYSVFWPWNIDDLPVDFRVSDLESWSCHGLRPNTNVTILKFSCQIMPKLHFVQFTWQPEHDSV
jgi:hypothetical protein